MVWIGKSRCLISFLRSVSLFIITYILIFFLFFSAFYNIYIDEIQLKIQSTELRLMVLHLFLLLDINLFHSIFMGQSTRHDRRRRRFCTRTRCNSRSRWLRLRCWMKKLKNRLSNKYRKTEEKIEDRHQCKTLL